MCPDDRCGSRLRLNRRGGQTLKTNTLFVCAAIVIRWVWRQSGLLATLVRASWKTLLEIDRFVRLHFFGFATMLCLLGAVSTAGSLTGIQILGLLAIALCFHNYAYVLNDVIDLPVDRGQPSRQPDPLVRGAIRPATALVFALAQIPPSFVLATLYGADRLAYFALVTGYIFMGIYNLWGKKCSFPLATDTAQGLAWGSLAYVGAGVAGGSPNAVTFVVFAYGATHIFLINGIHGGIRDLENDFKNGRSTTAIYLGVRANERGEIDAPPAVLVFSLTLQCTLVALVLAPLLRNDFGYSPSIRILMLALLALFSASSLLLVSRVARPKLVGWGISMRVHLFLIPLTLIVICLPLLSLGLAVLIVVLYALPVLTLEWTYVIFSSAWTRLTSRAGSNQGHVT